MALLKIALNHLSYVLLYGFLYESYGNDLVFSSVLIVIIIYKI